MRETVNSLSSDLDMKKFKQVSTHVDINSREVDSLVDAIVIEYCADLDDYMRQIDDILTTQVDPVSDSQLDEFTLNLPSLLYFTSSSQESLGIKEDVSRAIRNEIYNRVREKAQGTVADKDTAAELQTQSETIVLIAYNRAYKKVKLRVEAAYEMLNSVKKVMSRRIAEYDLNNSDSGRLQK